MSNPRIFYTTDIHIGHSFVARTRGFFKEARKPVPWAPEPDISAHDAWLADLWDSTIKENDVVYVVGDISINGGQHALDWVGARPGHKVLISGNHDPVHPADYRSFRRVFRRWLDYFDIITPYSVQKLVNTKFIVSHFPYSGTGSEGHGVEERYTQYRMPDLGMPLVHGHTHGPEVRHTSDKGTPQLHVGIDAWRRLVPQEEIIAWLEDVKEGQAHA